MSALLASAWEALSVNRWTAPCLGILALLFAYVWLFGVWDATYGRGKTPMDRDDV
jgi:hypothetical protein